MSLDSSRKKKTVIVTGASRGIGSEIAKAFAKAEYNVVINYLSSKDKSLELLGNLNAEGFSSRVFRADVSKKQEVQDLVQFTKEEFGNIDVLINNAGICEQKLFTDIDEEDWDKMMNVNIKSVYNLCSHVVPFMISEKSGKIINISSVWGMVGAALEVHYSTSKASIIGFTKALAKELGPSNIQVNCVCPGVINTDMNSDLNAQDVKLLEEQTPLGRLGEPSEVASLVLYLASNKANFLTGQVISPNGGFVV